MATIIDRRPQGGKSIENRDRFKKRFAGQIEKAVKDSISKKSITDGREQGGDVPIKGISEPTFRHGSGGVRHRVHPGNKKGDDGFIRGDTVPRPQGRAGGGGKASDAGEGEDDFIFHLTEEEYWDIVFNDLELPNLVKRHLSSDSTARARVPAGISNVGSPPQLSIPRSYRQALPRHRVFKRKEKKEMIAKLEKELAKLRELPETDEQNLRIRELLREITALKRKLWCVPFLDPTVDLRYHLQSWQPVPTAKAVMFCVMDVSGSMDEQCKELAKRFFLLLYRFLTRNYAKIELVFIRHTHDAKEVDEETFFYSKETGGTLVSSALKLMLEVIAKRYPPQEWNIYGAQAGDGDNWPADSSSTTDAMLKILPLVQYYAYVQVGPRADTNRSELWATYSRIKNMGENAQVFDAKIVTNPGQIYPVFHELFKKRGVV